MSRLREGLDRIGPKWPFWRKTMLAGALWLLVVAIASPALDTPGVLSALAVAVGYGTLMTGFYFAMKAKDRPDPTDPRKDDDLPRRDK